MTEQPQTPLLDQVSTPADLKLLTDKQLYALAGELLSLIHI